MSDGIWRNHLTEYWNFFRRRPGNTKKSTVAIAGVGGIGGLLAERLVRIGIGAIKITDPGKFELSNINRQFPSNTTNVGAHKVEVLANELKKINPDVSICFDCDGITGEAKAKDFIKGADLVVDEMDFGLYDKPSPCKEKLGKTI